MNDAMEEILDCGHPPSDHGPHTTGFGTDNEGRRYCWHCCGRQDEAFMREHGRISLYLCREGGQWKVSNWPGSVTFWPFMARKGDHNMAGSRQDVWFIFEGYVWHGVCYGDMTQICHCRRTKQRAGN